MSIMLDEANAYESSRDHDCYQIIDGASTVGYATNKTYRADRDAPPADAEIEAVAKKSIWGNMTPAWEDAIPSKDYLWTLTEPEIQDIYLMGTLIMLETAQKAVSERVALSRPKQSQLSPPYCSPCSSSPSLSASARQEQKRKPSSSTTAANHTHVRPTKSHQSPTTVNL